MGHPPALPACLLSGPQVNPLSPLPPYPRFRHPGRCLDAVISPTTTLSLRLNSTRRLGSSRQIKVDKNRARGPSLAARTRTFHAPGGDVQRPSDPAPATCLVRPSSHAEPTPRAPHSPGDLQVPLPPRGAPSPRALRDRSSSGLPLTCASDPKLPESARERASAAGHPVPCSVWSLPRVMLLSGVPPAFPTRP